MIDIQLMRDDPEGVRQKSKQKGFDIDVDQILGYDKKRLDLIVKVEGLRRQRNEIADENKGKKPSPESIERGRQLKEDLSLLEQQLSSTEEQLNELLLKVPNMPTDDTPIGQSEEGNVEVKQVGQRPEFDFEPKNHWQLGEARDWIDKERASKVAGSRFAYLKGELVLLEFALWSFGLSVLTDEKILKEIIEKNDLKVSPKAFTPVLPPAVAKTEVYEATGRLNKEEQTYRLADDDLWLNASAEHTMAPMHLGEILDEKDLPIRYVGYTTAFRREAGTYGKDMEGILRLHQFNKLEMETFSLPENSLQEHHFLVAVQEYLMQKLSVPYRVLLKCTADIGGPNARGVDIDVWLPGQGKYRETHTADYITDYQSRRLQTRVRRADGTVELVHTNDATAFSERPLIAILENYQTRDGRVIVPEVLRPFMGGKEKL